MEGQGTGHSTGRRVTMQEAAEILGVSVEAIRKRVQRGTIRTDKGEDGRRYVYLDTGRDDDPPEPQEADASRELIEELRDRVRSLERANEENRRIIAGLVQRVPELEAAPRESDLSASEEGSSPSPTEPRPAPERGGERPQSSRPWWRRIIGG